MEEKKRVYISLPITGHEDSCAERAEAAKKTLSEWGYIPVSPFDISHPDNATYAQYMGKDIEVMMECDAVCFLRGWHESKGCRAEYALSVIYGIETLFE